MAILFLGTSLVGAKYIAQATSFFGQEPLFFLNLNHYNGDSKRAIQQCEYYDVNIHDLQSIENAIIQFKLTARITAVTSLLDETLHLACKVAKRFGFIGPDQALLTLVDKCEVVKLIPEFCPETFIFKRNDINSGALEKFIRKNNRQKLLLKPGITSGGVGMEQIDYPSDVSTIKSFIDKAPHACQYQSSWMVQKCYEGELYSLEGFVLHDQITYLGFSHRIRQGYVEYSNEYPAQKQLTEPVKNSCFNAVSTLINRSNYRNGYFHCEFIIANGASYLIDANMGRIAGSAIIEQLAVAYEKLPEEILQHVFDVGLFGGKYSAGFSYVMLQDTMTMAVKYKALHDMDVVEVSFPQDLPIYHTRVFPNNDGWIGYLSGKKSDVDYALHKLTIHAKDNISDPYFVLGYKEGV